MALSLKDLMQHLPVLGGTGSGKMAGLPRPIAPRPHGLGRANRLRWGGFSALHACTGSFMAIHPFVQDKLPQLRDLCRRYHVIHLALFGSAATGTFDPERSDLDFVLDMQIPAPDGTSALHNYFGFIESVEALYGRKVDTVPPIAEIENRYLRENVRETAVALYDA